MLGGLLKKKKTEQVAARNHNIIDRTMLDRRVLKVLARSTSHELSPPELSPEDYYEAGFVVVPPGKALSVPAEHDAAVVEAVPAASPDEADQRPEPGQTDLEDVDRTASDQSGEGALDEDPAALPSSAPREMIDKLSEALAVGSTEPPSEPVETGPQEGDKAEEAVAISPSFEDGESAADEASEADAEAGSDHTEAATSAEGVATEPVPAVPASADQVPPVEAIYVSTNAMNADDAAELAAFVTEEVDYFLFDAGFNPDELPHAAMMAWCANFFAVTATKDGVGRFAHEAIGEPDLWQTCVEGLETLGATGHLKVLEDLRALLTWDAATARQVVDDPDFGATDPNLRALDDALREAEAAQPLAPVIGTWLRERPEIEVLDEPDVEQVVTGLAAHPALRARQAAAQQDD